MFNFQSNIFPRGFGVPFEMKNVFPTNRPRIFMHRQKDRKLFTSSMLRTGQISYANVHLGHILRYPSVTFKCISHYLRDFRKKYLRKNIHV